ncbi:hypothetical protein O181_090287 [Austropuccinia psidii MF-1]|uniref:Uncharacterized protein n=1 Tax=Austropuccinia psidii MF-1 TaxID=1389203 RepID=A0A9Q3IV29_9BASI|nr:hypothetical protein [Austropuccinia psidii MF-1]
MANPAQPQVATLPVLKSQASSSDISNSDQKVQDEPLPQADNHFPSSMAPVITRKPRYDYVLHYDTDPHNISSELNAQKILRDEKCQRCPPNQSMLSDIITYKQALSNPE